MTAKAEKDRPIHHAPTMPNEAKPVMDHTAPSQARPTDTYLEMVAEMLSSGVLEGAKRRTPENPDNFIEITDFWEITNPRQTHSENQTQACLQADLHCLSDGSTIIGARCFIPNIQQMIIDATTRSNGSKAPARLALRILENRTSAYIV